MEVFETRIKSMIKEEEKMSNETRAYGEKMQSLFLEAVVRLRQEEITTQEQLMVSIFRELAKLIKTAIAGYEELPDTAKMEIDRYYCLRTFYRVMMETGAGKYQAIIDAFAAQN
ncbi:hypothetical protein PFISCL1PPCAC_28476 [Pristionchus fissidentatus]|uniref:Nuclear receptor n=1 Tax=Pristionchus fissidentatus TaxID=1538716 RepID=A0AAV5X4M6_9BILA|nr:hypothetical protein PFISCL1PPCAC_28476 [Pristionchus fissidentatus]